MPLKKPPTYLLLHTSKKIDGKKYCNTSIEYLSD